MAFWFIFPATYPICFCAKAELPKNASQGGGKRGRERARGDDEGEEKVGTEIGYMRGWHPRADPVVGVRLVKCRRMLKRWLLSMKLLLWRWLYLVLGFPLRGDGEGHPDWLRQNPNPLILR